MSRAVMLLSVREAAKLMGMSSKTVHRLIQAGKLPAINLTGRTTRIRSTDLEDYYRKQTGKPLPKDRMEPTTTPIASVIETLPDYALCPVCREMHAAHTTTAVAKKENDDAI